MFSAVHSDRSGRIVVAADYGAALSDGHSVRAFARAISLPPGTEVVALADREAVGLDRAGRVRPLGDGRWAVGAILPLGHLRTALPAYLDESTAPAAVMCARLRRATPPTSVNPPPTYQPPDPSAAIAST